MERLVLDAVDSTNAEAARRAGMPGGPLWILALSQSAGRGRRGRGWVSPAGNFAATLVMRPAPPPAEAALRSFVAALALADALDGIAGLGDRLRLKWPNDVLLDGGKLAGILLEAGQGQLCVGIGVNLAAHPAPDDLPEGALPGTSIAAATGLHIAPETLLDHLAPAFAAWEARLATYGFAPIRTAFLARAARLGERITVRTGGAPLDGRFEDIDATGALVLAGSGGRVSVSAGDVHF